MPRITRGPATHFFVSCACGAKTSVPAGTVGNVRCAACGAINRARRS